MFECENAWCSTCSTLKMTSNNFRIAALHPNVIYFVVTGLIIGKSNMSRFENKQQCSYGVVKFLVRDSCDHSINLTVWGTVQFISDYDDQFTIGHVIRIVNSRISTVRHDDTFNPITSSPLQLTINEGFGSIEHNDGDDDTELKKFLNITLKSPDLALSLADIASTPSTTSDAVDLVDLFVVVAKLKPTRQVGDKSVRDVIVVDQTVPGMYLTTWNKAWIKRFWRIRSLHQICFA